MLQPGFVSDRATIVQAITWLMSDLQPGDSLVFHFSGHGGQQRDPTGEGQGLRDCLPGLLVLALNYPVSKQPSAA